jgi:hypothetical protein
MTNLLGVYCDIMYFIFNLNNSSYGQLKKGGSLAWLLAGGLTNLYWYVTKCCTLRLNSAACLTLNQWLWIQSDMGSSGEVLRSIIDRLISVGGGEFLENQATVSFWRAVLYGVSYTRNMVRFNSGPVNTSRCDSTVLTHTFWCPLMHVICLVECTTSCNSCRRRFVTYSCQMSGNCHLW